MAWSKPKESGTRVQRRQTASDGETVPPVLSHDEHLLDDQLCACGSPIMYRRRVVMGQRGGMMMFAAWCQTNSEHVLPTAMRQEIAELRSTLGPPSG